MVRHAVSLGVRRRLDVTNKAPDMHWEFGPLVASQQSLKRSGVLQVGHQADICSVGPELSHSCS